MIRRQQTHAYSIIKRPRAHYYIDALLSHAASPKIVQTFDPINHITAQIHAPIKPPSQTAPAPSVGAPRDTLPYSSPSNYPHFRLHISRLYISIKIGQE
ncbi:hypothetical protein JTE90_001347 [Oedothorax gibbosus]|uniref:Uncharacterized protein n=1 Tax=Oedothorax gibbosus TaxID=931172 RepID=A0AAV6TTT3_9ARAC|nr:hypothetical protein JTE90_001347 [Oedothorax gibbosus]